VRHIIDRFISTESWLRSWNESYRSVAVFGGLASGGFSDQTTQIYLDGEVFEDGGWRCRRGDLKLSASFRKAARNRRNGTLTRVEQNLIDKSRIAGYSVRRRHFKTSARRAAKAAANLLIGLGVERISRRFSIVAIYR